MITVVRVPIVYRMDLYAPLTITLPCQLQYTAMLFPLPPSLPRLIHQFLTSFRLLVLLLDQYLLSQHGHAKGHRDR
jgi:hypothetical protein